VCQRSKVAVLSSAHPPFDNRIFRKECVSLAAAGFDVTYVVPHDHDEEVLGIQIKHVPKPTGHLQRMTRTAWHVYRIALRERAAIYHIHDPELIPFGIMLKLKGKRVIYDAHEDVISDVRSKDWIPAPLRGLAASIAGIFELLAGRLFDGIFAPTPVITRRFPQKKTRLIRNYAIAEEFAASDAMPYSERPPLIVYVGQLSHPRGAREMIQALGMLPKSVDVEATIGGAIVPPLTESDLSLISGWEKVRFLGYLDRGTIGILLGRSRVGLVLFLPVNTLVHASPHKLFEYMSAGIPVVASDFPLWRPIVNDANCGFLVDPTDPRAAAHAIRWLLEHPQEAEAMGKRGQEAVQSRYNWDAEARQMINFYKSLLEMPSGT